MEEKRIFKVTKSKTVHIVTIVVWIIITVLCLFILWQGIKHPIGLLIVVPILAIVISVLVYYYRQSPQYIELTDDALVLHCMTGHKVFCYEDITEAFTFVASMGKRRFRWLYRLVLWRRFRKPF